MPCQMLGMYHIFYMHTPAHATQRIPMNKQLVDEFLQEAEMNFSKYAQSSLVVKSNKFDTSVSIIIINHYAYLLYRYFIDVPSVNGEMIARTRFQDGRKY